MAGSIPAGSRSWSPRPRRELDGQLVRRLGEQAAYEAGVHGLHPELIKLIGRMKYRTSYGQNILEHSKEVAWLAGNDGGRAASSTCSSPSAAALLHDVGKVLTHENEGTHVELGVEVARKYGESAAVINCIQAHHDDVPHESHRIGAGAGRRRDQRLPARRAARGVRELREAAHQAGGDRDRLRGRGEDQRHPGRPGGSGRRDARDRSTTRRRRRCRRRSPSGSRASCSTRARSRWW